jgi:hypothetical protein
MMAGVRRRVLDAMSEQWDAFGPIACIFWLCWAAFAAFAVVALAVGNMTFLVEAGLGLFITTLLFEVVGAVSDRL